MVALKELGSKLSYNELNDMLKLYPADSAPENPYSGQIWLDTTTRTLYRFVGTEWRVIGMTGSQILSKILSDDGSGSGLDSDLLDGQEGSFYQDASNLNAGTVPGARYAFWEDAGGENSSPYIQSGVVGIAAAVTTINFPSAFTSIPRSVAVPYTANASYAQTIHTRNTTTTSFRVGIFDSSGNLQSGTVVWIAIGEQE